MKRLLAAVIAAVLLLSFPVAAETESNRIELFVDNKVEVSGDGSIGSPFKTIDEAQKKVREIVASADYPQGGVVVFLREGKYVLSDSICLNEEDSGKEGAPVVWRSYYNEDVTLSTGAEIPLSSFTYSSDSRIPDSAKGKILSYNLRDNGIEGYDGLFLGGHSQHYYWIIGMAEEGAPQFGYSKPELFFGDEVGELAKYPNNNEWMGVKSVVDSGLNDWADDNGFINGYNKDNVDLTDGMTLEVNVDSKRMKNWVNAKNPWFDSYWRYDWSDFSGPLGEIDPQKKTIKTACAVNFSCDPSIARWRIYNLIEELDAPGEWFYDDDNGELYVFPPAGIKSDDNVVLAFQRKSIFELRNAHDIVIRNLNLTGTRMSGIDGENCNRIEVAYNDVTKCSYNAIKLYTSNDCYIHGNIVSLIGSKAIAVTGGDKETLTPSNTLVENNYVTKFARILKAYNGGIDVQGVGIKIRNNSISDAQQLAIAYGGNDHLFERNDIHDVVKEAADMGAVYRYWSREERGNVFKNNVFHDLSTDSADNIGIFGLYWDGGSGGETAIGNVFYNIDGTGIFMNCGRAHTVKDNIFINVTGAGTRFAAIYKGTQLASHNPDGADVYAKNPAYAKYPDFVNLFEDPDDWRTTKNCVVKDNIGYNTPTVTTVDMGGTSMTWDLLRQWNEYEEGVNYTEDPGFLSIDNNNYTLMETSKVFNQMPSFKEAGIDMSKMGTLTGMWEHYLNDNSLVFKKDSIMSYVDFEEQLLQNPLKTADDATYIPLRYSYEGMDYTVNWDSANNAVNVSSKLYNIVFNPDSAEYVVNDENKTLKHKILFENGVTYISADDFAEVTGISLYTTDDGLYIFSEKDLSGVIYDDMLKDLRERLEM